MLDLLFVGLYFVIIAVIGFLKRAKDSDAEASFLLSGRTLTLPAFVATLVSTWYGGILGVGEYTVQFGISQWFLFGLPYYIFALLFAVFLAGKIREHKALSIPEAVGQTYGKHSGRWAGWGVFLLVNPAPYILMLATLLGFMLGNTGDLTILLLSIAVGIFSALYVGTGGFSAVVRTDVIQMALMYIGFGVLLAVSWKSMGSPLELVPELSEIQLDPLGGQSWQYALVWFFIALWTFVDPGFHQRAAAAKDGKTARNGIFVSILFWLVFDSLSLITALYGSVYFGELSNPALVYPMLSEQMLSPFWNALFLVALFATIMSTLDSFLFLAGQTLGRDLMAEHLPTVSGVARTRIGIAMAVVIAILLVIIFPSVVQLWYVIGSVCIPVLLLPILGVYLPLFRMKGKAAVVSMVVAAVVSISWLALGALTGDDVYSFAWLGIEPFYPGLFGSIVVWVYAKFPFRADPRGF